MDTRGPVDGMVRQAFAVRPINITESSKVRIAAFKVRNRPHPVCVRFPACNLMMYAGVPTPRDATRVNYLPILLVISTNDITLELPRAACCNYSRIATAEPVEPTVTTKGIGFSARSRQA